MSKAKTFNPVDAAYAVAQYLPADPAVWLDNAALAGLVINTDGEQLMILYGRDDCPGDRNAQIFFNCWLSLTPGGIAAVIDLLMARRQKIT